ncbi:MAG: DUF1837 domain-containing protein [Bacteroidales bacterium]|nr:DUF1837 domain-containing protein [Bacteroidales bacterium]
MAFIEKFFTEDSVTYAELGITAYVFDDTKTAQFISECLVPFREAYIKEEKLVEIVNDFGTTRKQEIEERLPKTADVKAGDFGEILTYYLACEVWHPDVNVCPMKWRLKDKKDAASNYTDVLVFKSDPNGACPDDTMFSFEVKVRATVPSGHYTDKKGYKAKKEQCVFIDAVMDADKDRVSRAAESIYYLLTRCKDLGLKVEYKQIYRFAEPYNTVTYQKLFTAVAIVDSAFTAKQFAKLPNDLFTTFPNIRVFLVPIAGLQTLYENVLAQLPNA